MAPKFKVSSTQRTRGRNINITMKITSSEDRSAKEEPVEFLKLEPFIWVQFKILISPSTGKLLLSVSFRLHEDQKKANSRIDVTCKINGSAIHYVCESDSWSGYFIMETWARNVSSCKCLSFLIEANIHVTIMKPGPYPCLYTDDNFCDFHLSTGDFSIPVHKSIIAVHSEVFKRMLNGEWKETAKDCLEVEGVTQQTLQQLKDYMYLGSLPGHEDLRPLLLIAKCYMMQHLEEACSDKLILTVKPENLMDLFKFAMDNNLLELILSIMEHTSQQVIDSVREAAETSKLEKLDK